MSGLGQNQYDISRRSITPYSEEQLDRPGYLACARHRVVTAFQSRLQTYRIATERRFLLIAAAFLTVFGALAYIERFHCHNARVGNIRFICAFNLQLTCAFNLQLTCAFNLQQLRGEEP